MDWNSTDSISVRKFGFIALIFFGCLFSIALWAGRPVATCIFGSLGLLGLGFVLFPVKLKPVHRLWMKVAHLIGRAVTILILTLAYYLVITPSAMIKRVMGGAPIQARPDRNASSYWVARTEPAQPKERFLKRF